MKKSYKRLKQIILLCIILIGTEIFDYLRHNGRELCKSGCYGKIVILEVEADE